MPTWLTSILTLLALPEFGLTTLFVVSFISATLVPVGSEPALFGLLKLNPDLFWPAIAAATLGNTAGGMADWLVGRGARGFAERITRSRADSKALALLSRLGPRACFFAWLPIVGDPLCAVAGWLRLPFWPCTGYMLVGKALRYILMTAALLYLFPGRIPLH